MLPKRTPVGPGCLLLGKLGLLGASLPMVGCLSSLDGGHQEQLAESNIQTTEARICAGQTEAGSAAWQVDREDVVHADVDTSACGFSKEPLYFTSLSGSGPHWASRGATSIYRASRNGFRVVVSRQRAGESALMKNWRINWLARPAGLTSKELCTDRTEPGDFVQAGDNGLKVKVDLRACGFEAAPVLLTSLGGQEGHALTRGATSVYWVDEDSFTVFIQKRGIRVEDAVQWGWHINWSATPELNDSGSYCTGKTTAEGANWQQLGRNSLSAQVTTEACQAPLVFATMGGRHSHWYAMGPSSIYERDNGFQVKIQRYRASPAWALEENWHIHWTRVSPTLGAGD